MQLADLKSRIWEENVLFTVMLELTYRCNLDCFFCYNDRGLNGTPLSLEQYELLLHDLAEMRVVYLVLSGGEPLAHPNFFRIGRLARELGFVIRIKSNGHALDQRKSARLKSEIDPFIIEISLHGASPETHDRQTQVPGSFDTLMKNLEVLRENDLRFRLNGTLTRWNEHEIEQMFAIAESWNVPFNLNLTVTPRDDGDMAPLEIAPSRAAMELAMAMAQSRSISSNAPTADTSSGCDSAQEKPGKVCGSGSSTLTIDPVGNVLPCVQWRRPVGNLHREPIRTIWNQSNDLRAVRETAIRAREMIDSEAENGPLLNYCMGEAVAFTGSPLTPYESIEQQRNIRLKLISG